MAARMGAGPLIQGRELWLMLRYLRTVAGDPHARASCTGCAAHERDNGRRDQRANLLKRRFHVSPALSSVFNTHFLRIVLIARDDVLRMTSGSGSFARCAVKIGVTTACGAVCGFAFFGFAGTASATLAG
ncbi:hypothetical protein F7D13_08720 [Methylocystis rosea]|uniref:Uncharacterized protein n=1 Tax=Methylocystis rosea TaxID=173366 RepID=A0ABX6EJJ0_9HYPH|nr:hypothetical protein [Methylocystis rosea]QGM94101.1 hypothetical protein F7D13_08720 [Methylocystis rosea]